MGFRRYGGDLENKQLGGHGKLTWPAFTITLLGTYFAIKSASILIFIISVLLSLTVLFLGQYIQGSGKNRIRSKRREKHVKEALEYIELNEMEKAKESIRRVKIYGKLPASLETYEIKTGKNA